MISKQHTGRLPFVLETLQDMQGIFSQNVVCIEEKGQILELTLSNSFTKLTNGFLSIPFKKLVKKERRMLIIL
jgi:hypothetical protein